MSKFFVGFLNTAQLAALHNAGHAVEQFALSEPAKLVAHLKTTSIGAIVAADVKAFSDKSMSGADKFAAVLANTLPLVLHYAAAPGTIIADAAGIARALVQDVYNDFVGAVKAAVPAVVSMADPVPAPAPVEATAFPPIPQAA